MATLEELRERLPEPARDLKVNLQVALDDSSLGPVQRYAVAYVSALASRNTELAEALRIAGNLPQETVDDAIAANAIMGMNNVFYRFKHFVEPLEVYEKRHARLRMQRIAKTTGPRVDFELMCIAASAINGCEVCIRAHDKTAKEQGATEDHVWDTARIASIVHGVAAALG